MGRNALIAGTGLVSVGIGSYAMWYAFEYPLCAMGDECAPNAPIAAGGALAIVAGIGLLLFVRNRSESSSDGVR